MKFYETETEFVLLKEGDKTPENCIYYTFREHMYFSDFTINKFELKISHYFPEFSSEDFTYFTYKGFSFKIIGNPIGSELIELLNKLKKGDHDKILLEMMTTSMQIFSEFNFNINTNNIKNLNKEIKKLTENIDKIKRILSEIN